MTHNHSLFGSLCTQRWTRACSLSPEAPSFWLAFQARPALCMHVFVKVQCSTLGSTLEDKCFSFFSTDWRWQWWRTSNSAVTAFIAKRPRVAYSCSYVLLLLLICDRKIECNKREKLQNAYGRLLHGQKLTVCVCARASVRMCECVCVGGGGVRAPASVCPHVCSFPSTCSLSHSISSDSHKIQHSMSSSGSSYSPKVYVGVIVKGREATGAGRTPQRGSTSSAPREQISCSLCQALPLRPHCTPVRWTTCWPCRAPCRTPRTISLSKNTLTTNDFVKLHHCFCTGSGDAVDVVIPQSWRTSPF